MPAWVERPLPLYELGIGQTTAGTTVSVYYDPESPTGQVDAIAGTLHLVAGFDWYETTLGPYPFGTKVGAVAVPWPSTVDAWGMEHHPFWHVREDEMKDELTQLHEAAHGWFGNGVRLACWNDLVLTEGTSSYLAARAYEAASSATDATFIWNAYENLVDAYRNVYPHTAWPEGCDAYNPEAYTMLTYARGALLLRAIEETVGRPALDHALSTFYELFVGQAGTMSDLLATILLTTGYDPRACADDWLRKTSLPPYLPCD